MPEKLKIILIGVTAIMAGCAYATHAQLLDRASFDLNCPEEQLRIERIDSRTRGVRGCGRQGVYIENCQTCSVGDNNSQQRCNCTWVVDSKNGFAVVESTRD
jgi:hypothetical protein